MNAISRPLLVPILAICVLFIALVHAVGTAAASVIPTSLSVGAGFTRDLGPYPDNTTLVPMVATTWLASPRWAIRSSFGFLRDQILPEGYYGVTGERRQKHSYFVPIAVGLRFYPARATGPAPGLFIDAAPTAFASHVESYFYPEWNTVRLGYQATIGTRLTISGRSRAEIGATFFHIDGTNTSSSERRVSGRAMLGREIYTIGVSVGFGD